MLGFSRIWMLGALAAVLLPVLIHLMTRPKPRKVYFPAYRFLMEAGGGKQRLHQLRTVLVLLCRCLAVAMLVLLFAKPLLKSSSRQVEGAARHKAVLIVDATLSMQAEKGGSTLFDRARAEACELIRGLGEDDEIGLVFIEDRPRAFLPVLSGNFPALIAGLETAKPSAAACDPNGALGLARRMLSGPGSIYVFSDFQLSNWRGADLSSPAHQTVLRPVADRAVDNMAVTDIQVSPSNPVAGEPIAVMCRILNATAQHRQAPVELSWAGERHLRNVDVKPYETATAIFDLAAEAPGSFKGSVRLQTKDGLQIDNERFFKADVQESAVVLIISDRDERDVDAPAFYLKTAIAPYEKETGVRVAVRHSQSGDIDALDTADTFVLCPPVTLTERLASAISSRVYEGLQLICFLDGSQASETLEILRSASEGAIDPPFRLLSEATASLPEGDPLTRIDYSRPPLRLFGEPGGGDLSALRFARHYQTLVAEGRSGAVLMYFPDGAAAMASVPVGRGLALIMNFPLSPAAGNFTASPLFPAFMHECLSMAGPRNPQSGNSPGGRLDILVPGRTSEDGGSLTIESPDGRHLAYTETALGNYTKLTVARVHMPGIYPVSQMDREAGFGVVNIDPTESDTRLAAVSEISGGGRSDDLETVVAGATEALLARDDLPLWPYAAMMLAGLLCLEMLMLAFWRKPNG